MTIPLEELLEIAKIAAKKAGIALHEKQNEWCRVISQEGHDIKLEADHLSESVIIEYLQKHSSYRILAEEGGWKEGDDDEFSEENMRAFAQRVYGWKKIRMLGTATMALVYVAYGKAETYMETSVMFWDVAAAIAIAKSAGAYVECQGEAIDQPWTVTVTNGKVQL